jgi:hypothetical protein
VRLPVSSGGETAGPLERLAIGVASLVVAIGAIAALSGFFAARDQAGVSGSQSGPGLAFPDLGHLHLQLGELRPAYNSNPPTSGAHVPQPVLSDDAQLSDDQLLEALELGDVVVMYGGPAPPPELVALSRSTAAPFSPALAAAGQAVILGSRPGTHGLIGLAWARMLRVPAATDPRLRDFVQFWLGKGAPRRH